MKKIEITTAQKVTIQYELASLRDRILAFFVDMIILGIGLLVIYLILISITLGGAGGYELLDMLFWIIMLPIFLLYTLVSELITNGKTLGKKALGLKVVKLNGGTPAADDFLVRWVFRWIDIWTSFGAVAALLISSGDKSQRIGGLLSNTAVVKLRGGFHIRLDDLERMFHATDDYEPRFPQVTMFNDGDMLAVKELISRYSRYPNQAQFNLMEQTVISIAKKLDLEETPKNKVGFLQRVLKDYVMLTR